MNIHKVTSSLRKCRTDHIICIASVTPGKSKDVDPEREPVLAAIYKLYPHANVYTQERKSRRLGHIVIMESSDPNKPNVVHLIARHRPYRNNDDNVTSRKAMFESALSEATELQCLQNIVIPSALYVEHRINAEFFMETLSHFIKTINLKNFESKGKRDNMINLIICEDKKISRLASKYIKNIVSSATKLTCF